MFFQSSISGILINILIGRRFILAMSGLALSSHSALIPHLLTWPTTTKRPSPALLLPDQLLNRAVEKYSYLTTSMATSYLLLLTRRPAHLINLLNSSNLYIICTLQQSDSASVSYVYLDVSVFNRFLICICGDSCIAWWDSAPTARVCVVRT